MTSHTATFRWPDTQPSSVIVTGTFDNWSGNTHHLRKEENGFVGQVELAFNSSYDFKYVVDGQWQVRDDEGKSWDAAGNVNNVYLTGSPRTPPPASPVATPEATPSDSAPITHASLLSSSIPGEASSIAESTAAVKDEPLVSVPSASASEFVPASVGEEQTPAQAIIEQVEAADEPKVEETVESSPATTPKPIIKALEPITSQEGGDAQAFLDESTATLAAAGAAIVAGGTGLAVAAEALIFGKEDTPVEKAAEDQTDRLKELDTAVPVMPVPPTANYINQDATKTSSVVEAPAPVIEKPAPVAEKTAIPIESYSLGRVLDSEAVEGASENGTVATDFSVVDAASTTSASGDAFEHVPAPVKLADEPAVVVPKPSEEKFQVVEKEEAVVNSSPVVESPRTPTASSSAPESLVPEVISSPPAVPEEPTFEAAAPTPVEATTVAPLKPVESLTAPVITSAPFPTTETTPAPSTPTKSTPPPSTNGAAASSEVISEGASTPVKNVPGSFPESNVSTPASTPASTPTKAAQLKAEEEKLRKRKSSIFGKLGSMFGGGSKKK